MALFLQTPPALEPLSLADAKSFVRVDHADEDALIQSLIVRARAWVEEATGRALLEQTWDYWLDGWPFARLGQSSAWWDGTREGPFASLHPAAPQVIIPKGPVISVVDIVTVDSAGTESTWDPVNYRADLHGPRARVLPAAGVGWPMDGLRSSSSVRIRFKAGFGATPGSVPAPLVQAVSMLVAHWFDNRGSAVVGSITTDQRNGVESLLAPYREVVL